MALPSEITNIIAAGVERSVRCGYTKPHDIATAIKVELAAAGFRIVRKPVRSSK